MRSILMIFMAVIFVLRGFTGQAMAVEMLYAEASQGSLSQAEQAQSIHSHCQNAAMMQTDHGQGNGQGSIESGNKSSSHGNCGLCCVIAALPAPLKILPTVQPETLVMAHPVRFVSNIPPPALKPPVL